MGLNNYIAKITDPYDRNARLYPALLAMLPLVIMLGVLYDEIASLLSGVVITAFSFGGLFLMMNIAREMGERLEQRVYDKWGSKPTTILLRHSDKRVDTVTKQRYHRFLSDKIKMVFPERKEEERSPDSADDIYESATKWLRDHTRDKKKFWLLFNENMTYGFRRNALGVKPIGITVSFVCILWVLIAHQVILLSNPYFNHMALSTLSNTAISSLAVSAIMLCIWLLFVTETSLKTAAFTYAETLLRACDDL